MRLFLALLIAISLFACQPKDLPYANRQLYFEIEAIDKEIYNNPDQAIIALDSLAINSNNRQILSYVNLLRSIAYEQIHGVTNMDSSIRNAFIWYSNHGSLYNQCRAKLYHSLSLFNKNRNDSLAYRYIAEAEELYNKFKGKDLNIEAKLYYVLGKLHRAASNKEVAHSSLVKSLKLAAKANNKSTEYQTRFELFGLFLSQKEYSKALETISTFADEEPLPAHIELQLQMAMYNYFTAKKESAIAIEYLKKAIQLKSANDKLELNCSRIYYFMGLHYNRLGDSENARKNVELAVKSIPDSSKHDSHFYYRLLAEIKQKEGNNLEAATLYNKAYISYIQAYTRINREKTLELESNFKAADQKRRLDLMQKRLNQKSALIVSLISLLVLVALVLGINLSILFKQYSDKTNAFTMLVNESNKWWLLSTLFQENSKVISDFIEKAHKEIGKARKISPEIYESLNSILDEAVGETRAALPKIVAHEHFAKSYEDIAEIEGITDFERMVLVLEKEGFSMPEIAYFLNSSNTSIRTIRGKVVRKISKNNSKTSSDEVNNTQQPNIK